MQHRIKNNIGVITSLVWMRSRATESAEARNELQAVAERIETLRLVHEQLYAAGTVNSLTLRPYLTRLVESLCTLYADHSGAVQLDIDIDEVTLPPEIAAPLGLLLNEFTTNSLKYAFGGQGGRITIKVKSNGANQLNVCLSDDGKGLPERPRSFKPGSGTGMKLIDGLARQVESKADWSSTTGTTLKLALAV